jgi:hypothetical protein
VIREIVASVRRPNATCGNNTAITYHSLVIDLFLRHGDALLYPVGTPRVPHTLYIMLMSKVK